MTCPKRILNINPAMKKYKNIGYALAIFFYIDLSAAVTTHVGKDMYITHQIKMDAKSILDTPDLTTGLEELNKAVEMDLCDMEKTFQQNS